MESVVIFSAVWLGVVTLLIFFNRIITVMGHKLLLYFCLGFISNAVFGMMKYNVCIDIYIFYVFS